MPHSELEISNKLIYDEIIKIKGELKSIIEETEVRLVSKLDQFSNRLDKLEKENHEIKSRIEFLERNQKRNNVVIFGLKKEINQISPENICSKLNQVLDTNLAASDINNAYALGNHDNSPIKVELLSYWRKNSVIKNCFKLKGTRISIAHDLTIQQRQENQTLRRQLNIAKRDKNIKCYIKQNKLHLNEQVYTPEDLKDIEDITQYIRRTKPTSTLRTSHIPDNQEAQELDTENQGVNYSLNANVAKSQVVHSTPKTGAIKKSREVTLTKIKTRNRVK